jgi:hypothetical protein
MAQIVKGKEGAVASDDLASNQFQLQTAQIENNGQVHRPDRR